MLHLLKTLQQIWVSYNKFRGREIEVTKLCIIRFVVQKSLYGHTDPYSLYGTESVQSHKICTVVQKSIVGTIRHIFSGWFGTIFCGKTGTFFEEKYKNLMLKFNAVVIF